MNSVNQIARSAGLLYFLFSSRRIKCLWLDLRAVHAFCTW